MDRENQTIVSRHAGRRRYYSLNDYCQETYGEKVYRLSLNGGMTCPNRDGSLSTKGCAFCSLGGSGDFAADRTQSISTQLIEARKRIANKTNCRKFIAYFQAYTNTYAPIEYLEKILKEAISPPEIVALAIGTRSDCLEPEVIQLLTELNQQKPIWVELGLQTIHNGTLSHMNTHTTVEQYDSAVHTLSALGLRVITHLILGLPGENRDMMLKSVRHVASSASWGIKLQLLHILRGTALADWYEKEPFSLFTLEEYCDFIIDCVELLPPEMVIHRLTGDGPKSLLVAPLWSGDKKRVLGTIQQRFRERDTWQGRLWKPDSL